MWTAVLLAMVLSVLPVSKDHLITPLIHRIQHRVIVKRHHPFRGMLRGFASWYNCCNTTANGERFNVRDHTCAMLLWPINTVVRIYDLATGRTSWCRVNDHGPYVAGRVIDLTPAVASDLHLTGVDPVELYKQPR